MADKTPELSKNIFTFGNNNDNIDDNKEDDEDLIDAEEECVKYEGYVFKYSQTQKKMKKIYFRLIGKDLYYYKKKRKRIIEECII